MEHFARWVVRHRKAVLAAAVLLLIPSVFGAAGTYINYDILTYLPPELDSMVGEGYLEDDFNMASTSMITVENMSTADTLALKSELEAVAGVKSVLWTSDILDVTTPKEMLPADIQKFFYSENGATLLLVQFENPSAHAVTMQAQRTIKDILRKDWGFEGAVVTDWGGSNDHALGVKNGSTLEMPCPGDDSIRELVKAVETGKITEADVDARLEELLELVFTTKAAVDAAPSKFDAAAHHALARQAAAQSIVLLKNQDSLLPLAKGETVAVIGDFAKTPRYQGAGSSAVNSIQVDSFLDCLAESGLNSVGYAQGFDRQGKADQALQDEAVLLAKNAKVVLLCMGLDEIKESEGIDRADMQLAQNQLDLLAAVAAVNPNVVVLLSAGSSLESQWIKDCKALVYGCLGGQAGAGALVEVLTGAQNPSGKLAETWACRYADTPARENFGGQGRTVEYRESLYVGYRYYDTAGVPTAFPFGYGLSYTITIPLDDKAFRYWNVKTDRWEVEGGGYQLLVGASSADIRLTAVVTVEGTNAPDPYAGLALPHYRTGEVAQVPNAEYEALLGRPLPEGKVRIDRNMTLGEMGHGRSPLGWIAAAVLGALLNRSIKKGKPDLNILFQYNMPLRALAKMTNGAISMGMVDGIVMELKGFWIIGILRVIWEALKNVVLNSRMEERLKNS